MKVFLGETGLDRTWQDDFPKETSCVHCKEGARIAFVCFEENSPRGGYVCDLHKNDVRGEGYWPHDAVAVAIYFCRKCYQSTSLYNQA